MRGTRGGHYRKVNNLSSEKTTDKPLIRVHVDLILPFEFCPHTSELSFIAVRWLDVIHDIDMYVVEYDIPTVGGVDVVNDGAENHASLSRADFDNGLDTVVPMRRYGMGCRLFNKLQVSESRKV